MNNKIIYVNLILFVGVLLLIYLLNKMNWDLATPYLLAILLIQFIFCFLMIFVEGFSRRSENMFAYLLSAALMLLIGVGTCFQVIGAFS